MSIRMERRRNVRLHSPSFPLLPLGRVSLLSELAGREDQLINMNLESGWLIAASLSWRLSGWGGACHRNLFPGNGDQPFPVIAQVSLARNAQNAPSTLKDSKFWTAEEKKTRKIDRLARSLLICVVLKWKQYGTLKRQTKNLMDINIDALYNILKQNQGDVNDALRYKKNAVVITSDPLELVVEKTKVSKRKEKVGVSLDSEGSGADDFSELKKITVYCKKAKVKDYNYYKTKMLLAKKDSDEQVLLAKDQAWMESSSDFDQEININMVFMAQIEKVLSESDESSSSDEETIAEVSYYTSESESESEFETSEYYDNSTNYGLFVNNDGDQEIFYDAVESASENFIKNHIDSQKDYDKYEVDHNDIEEKEHLVDKLIRKFNHKIAKCHKRIEKANQQSKDFKNQNKDLQEKYDVLINQVKTFNEQNNEFNEQIKVLNEKNADLLDQTKVLKDQLQVKHIVIDTHVEYEVVSLLKKKANLKTIESLKSKGLESSENAISESENQSENDCHVVEKECDKVENSNIVHICLWVIDSGCSKHMTGNRALLTNFVENSLGTVRFGNNDFAVIAGYGDVSTCFVRNEDGVDLLTGDRSSNLYTIALNEVASNSSTCLLAKASSSQSWLWHQRLSHLNFATINNLVKNNLVQGLPKMKFEKDHLCFACEQGKIHRKHHKSKTDFASNKPLYLLHMDLCGPMRVESINGKRYVLVVVDDYSRLFELIMVRSLKKALAKFFDEVGITQQFSAARTPQQNGVVERRNRTLVEAARTMLTFANLPLFLWAEAIVTIIQICIWIINSGCSKHMTGNRALLTNFVKKFLGTVRFGNNDFAMISGYGDVVIRSMTTKKVYYMPPGIESDDYDSKGDTYFLEELLSNDSISLSENESSNFMHYDDPSFLRPPPKPLDV
uniref:Integrase catalytic domain-containing protein n=1 Tax=Tanacetum cinerariifolium TaxID=118510 RepID=A0A6L2KJU0_TANCI|nr:hypothetical protein [Tanacetum cinerariifolium]